MGVEVPARSRSGVERSRHEIPLVSHLPNSPFDSPASELSVFTAFPHNFISSPIAMAATAPSFSYAQAAKGRSPSLGPQAPSKNENSKTENTEPLNESATTGKRADSCDEPCKRELSARRTDTQGSTKSVEAEAKAVEDAPQRSQSVDEPRDPKAANTEAAPSGTSQVGQAPLGMKEPEGIATPNGSSESTWDKVSQVSQSEEKRSVKEEWDTEDVKMSSWEHVPEPAGLKEAPMPVVNVWQKRAQDAQSKGKEPRPATNLESTSKGTSDPKGEISKPDGRSIMTGSLPALDDRQISEDSKTGPKTADGKLRSDDGGRPSDDTQSTASAVAPPVDSSLWPTPKLAEEEEKEKRKTQGRSERADKEKTPSKPHGKDKWEKVPYVPSAVFNTPIPTTARRGGRGGTRGAREGGRGGHTGTSGERAINGGGEDANGTRGQFSERTRGTMGPPRGGASGSKPKRSASAGPPVSRDQRKDGEPMPEKRDDDSQRNFNTGPRYPNMDRRTSTTSTQTEVGLGLRQGSPPRRQHPASAVDRESGSQAAFLDYSHPRSNLDRRNDPVNRTSDFPRDQGYIPQRERGDSRSERGRGGYRCGRNGYPHTNANNYQPATNGPDGAPQGHGFTPVKSQSYLESRPGPQPGGPMYGPPRHHRSGSRSQSIPNQPPFSRFPGNTPPGGPPHLANLHTDVANMYGYQPANQPAVMSAMPFHPYMEHMQIQGMVLMQMDYYLSVDNLCKDMFLRKHMDSQGFVLLTVLANFNRIKQLTHEIDLIRYVCMRSVAIELVVGQDGKDRVRKAQDWQQWVLAMEDRDPSAQNDGPSQARPLHFLPPPTYGAPAEHMQAQKSAAPLSPRGSFNGSSRRPEPLVVNGNGSPPPITDAKLTQTPLSAAVPDFAPTVPQPSNAFQTTEDLSGLESTFSDEQVKNLVIVVRKPGAAGSSQRVTMPERSPRGLSPKVKPLESGILASPNRTSGGRSSPVIVNGDLATET